MAILYGGRSGEHEVSLRSAASVLRNLDPERFEIVPIAIDKSGRWLLNDVKLLNDSGSVLPVFKDSPTVVLPPHPAPDGGQGALMPLGGGGPLGASGKVDVVFPVMHGTYCEDGAIQGLLELADVAYVGCGILASAVGMDKEIAKRLVRDAEIAIVPYVSLRKEQWEKKKDVASALVQSKLGYPVFVKPANSGSSVGVHKVKEASGLEAALQDAFQFDVKVLVEKGLKPREIEVAVLENPDSSGAPFVSLPGEIAPTHEFYSYEAKYIDEKGADLLIPAKISAAQTREAQAIAAKVFSTLECEGMARVDLFLDEATGKFYFNEINTIPGFTSISMYPKMWEATGVPYRELLSKLIDLAIARQKRKRALVRDFHR